MAEDSRYQEVKSDSSGDAVVADKQSSESQPEPIVSDYSYGRNQEPLEPQSVRGNDSSAYGIAYDSSTQSVSSGGFVAGTFATYELSGVSSGTNSLIVDSAGNYLVTAGAAFTYGADGALRGISVQKNGSLLSPLQDFRNVLSGDDLMVNASGVFSLAVGDEIKMFVYNADSFSRNCTYRRLSLVKI